jgi:hypothetical protein
VHFFYKCNESRESSGDLVIATQPPILGTRNRPRPYLSACSLEIIRQSFSSVFLKKKISQISQISAKRLQVCLQPGHDKTAGGRQAG